VKVESLLWNDGKWNQTPTISDAQFVLYFGGQGVLDSGEHYEIIRQLYPQAHVLGCSTGGEIYQAEVLDQSISLAAVKFDHTQLRVAQTTVADASDSFAAGEAIAKELNDANLKSIFILSDGTNVNGSDLVNGIYSVVDDKVVVTGGLAGDGADFGTTLVGLDAPPVSKVVAAVGFYGDKIQVNYGSAGGWDTFGPERKITKSDGNILYELDGKPALDLYKQYLGEDAEKLPGSALLFPLSIRPKQSSEHDIVRTIVGVDEDAKTMIFAGDMPEGYTAQLMRGSFDHLVEGAAEAAGLVGELPNDDEKLVILVSCIGRKLLLGQSISDETEAVAEVFGRGIPTVGFYSYGEICHQQFTKKCGLHNQTMTVTVLHEDK
jgi:hypothetical protein